MPNLDIENQGCINNLEETVDLIASGYDWICPHCNHLNKEFEAGKHVACYDCGWIFKVGGVNHALP